MSRSPCGAWREHALRRIEREERPALVLAAGSTHHRVLSGGKQLGEEAGLRALADGWGPVLRRLRASADHVVVATDPPRAPHDVQSLRASPSIRRSRDGAPSPAPRRRRGRRR